MLKWGIKTGIHAQCNLNETECFFAFQVFRRVVLFSFLPSNMLGAALLLLGFQTFSQADSNGDGRIDPKEWKEFVKKNPASLRNMSLPYLQDITTSFPSFVMHLKVEDYNGVGK